MRYQGQSIALDHSTFLEVRNNGMWTIRRLTGGTHEGALYGRTVHEGHVLARGRVVDGNTLRVTRGRLTVPAIRKLIREGTDRDIKVRR